MLTWKAEESVVCDVLSAVVKNTKVKVKSSVFNHLLLFCRYPKMNAPIQVLMVGACLVFATPLCCALFPQMSSIKTKNLEPEVRDRLLARTNPPERVFFNKGL